MANYFEVDDKYLHYELLSIEEQIFIILNTENICDYDVNNVLCTLADKIIGICEKRILNRFKM